MGVSSLFYETFLFYLEKDRVYTVHRFCLHCVHKFRRIFYLSWISYSYHPLSDQFVTSSGHKISRIMILGYTWVSSWLDLS